VEPDQGLRTHVVPTASGWRLREGLHPEFAHEVPSRITVDGNEGKEEEGKGDGYRGPRRARGGASWLTVQKAGA